MNFRGLDLRSAGLAALAEAVAVSAAAAVAVGVAVTVAVTVAAAFAAAPLRAQDRPVASPLPQWELRADLIAATSPAAHLGVGLNVRAGWYARLGATLALGAAEGAGGEWRASQRADITARFLLDPFAERPIGLYGGVGVTARLDGDGPVDARLLLLLGAEGQPRRGVLPSLEIGLGGGVRLGVVLRRRRAESAR